MVNEQIFLDNNMSIRAYCFKMYKVFIENKDLDYSNFMRALKNNMGILDAKKIKFYINYIKQDISVKKAREMTLILKYMIAKEKNDIDKVEAIRKEIDEINGAFVLEAQTIGDVPKSKKHLENKKNAHINTINTLNKEMQLVIDEKRSYPELFKEGKIHNQNLLTTARKNIKEIDIDKYIEFLISNYNLDVTSYEELNQYIEVLQFYITNIDKAIEKLRHYYHTGNESEIRNLYVKEQEKLGENYSSIAKVYNWKVSKLKYYKKRYQKLIASISTLLGNDISSFDRENNTFMTSLRNEEDFIVDFYKNLLKIQCIYNDQIINNKYASDALKNEIKEKYTMKLLPGNNK